MINKTLLLSNLSLIPFACTPASTLVTTINNQVVTNMVSETNQDMEDPEACTMMYVGKNVSQDGQAYIVRSSDAGPTGMDLNCQIFEHNYWAGQEIKGKNGFSYQMPNTTYRYISTPRNPAMQKGLHWEVSGINEKGVGVTATLSCSANDLAQAADPLETTNGITEDNITQIVASTAASAREGIETVAKIMDTKGSGECNAIMVIDKDEAWYMEMYTGHQYAAIKLPDDKACTIGNEFMLDELAGFEDIIVSDKLHSLAKDNGFLQPTTATSVKEMNLFNTYGGEKDPGKFIDACHMRTWRGHNMFAYNNDPASYHTYGPQTKYAPFFVPDNKLSIHDIISFMRDRFDDILDDQQNPNHDYFQELANQHLLRFVADENAYQIHAITVNPDLPSEIAVQEWLCLSNTNYAPFIPLNNGITTMSSYYTRVTPHYCFDQESAVCVFKRLNALAAYSRKYFGLIIQSYLQEHEKAWNIQYKDLINQIKDLSLNKQKEILTNFCYSIQVQALTMSNVLYEDLLWHIINKTKSYYKQIDWTFYPLINIEYYAWLYGWKYNRPAEKSVILTNGDEEITIDLNYTWLENHGVITKKGQEAEKVVVSIKDNIPYLDYEAAKQYISSGKEVVEVDANEYLNPNNSNFLAWVLPISIIPPVAVGSALGICIYKDKKRKQIRANN